MRRGLRATRGQRPLCRGGSPSRAGRRRGRGQAGRGHAEVGRGSRAGRGRDRAVVPRRAAGCLLQREGGCRGPACSSARSAPRPRKGVKAAVGAASLGAEAAMPVEAAAGLRSSSFARRLQPRGAAASGVPPWSPPRTGWRRRVALWRCRRRRCRSSRRGVPTLRRNYGEGTPCFTPRLSLW